MLPIHDHINSLLFSSIVESYNPHSSIRYRSEMSISLSSTFPSQEALKGVRALSYLHVSKNSGMIALTHYIVTPIFVDIAGHVALSVPLFLGHDSLSSLFQVLSDEQQDQRKQDIISKAKGRLSSCQVLQPYRSHCTSWRPCSWTIRRVHNHFPPSLVDACHLFNRWPLSILDYLLAVYRQ